MIARPQGVGTSAEWNVVGPGFFQIMGMPLIAGRGIERADKKKSIPFAVVNRAFADYYLPGVNPIGHRVRIDFGPFAAIDYNIVGVSGTALFSGMRESCRFAEHEADCKRTVRGDAGRPENHHRFVCSSSRRLIGGGFTPGQARGFARPCSSASVGVMLLVATAQRINRSMFHAFQLP